MKISTNELYDDMLKRRWKEIHSNDMITTNVSADQWKALNVTRPSAVYNMYNMY